MKKGVIEGYRNGERLKNTREQGSNTRVYFVPDAKERYSKCKKCKYSSKPGLKAFDGERYYKIYQCNYILMKHEMRRSEPATCDKYESKKGINRYNSVAYRYEEVDTQNV